MFDPASQQPFRISRSKIDLFLNCPRCFYLDRRLGVGQPPGFPFTLNSAVDKLLKKEFDAHRAAGSAHPLMKSYGLDAIPWDNPKIEEWRDALGGGIQYFYPQTNLIITGAIDDLWINPQQEIIIVDYKSTAKDSEVNLDADWQIGYKRQMEIYQWLFRKNDFKVSDTGYFVYANGNADKAAFDARLEFSITLLSYIGNDSWVDQAIVDLHQCLISNEMPLSNPECDYCLYREAAQEMEK